MDPRIINRVRAAAKLLISDGQTPSLFVGSKFEPQPDDLLLCKGYLGYNLWKFKELRQSPIIVEPSFVALVDELNRPLLISSQINVCNWKETVKVPILPEIFLRNLVEFLNKNLRHFLVSELKGFYELDEFFEQNDKVLSALVEDETEALFKDPQFDDVKVRTADPIEVDETIKENKETVKFNPKEDLMRFVPEYVKTDTHEPTVYESVTHEVHAPKFNRGVVAVQSEEQPDKKPDVSKRKASLKSWG
ncbi:hypothetical protein EZS27_017203 [termite gut metagenome]|uniref:Uncharacterized protein n=1 Tax=termite gut metagenome TaxID=433724 RepID=A0A5J4RLG7_9ZZZZ